MTARIADTQKLKQKSQLKRAEIIDGPLIIQKLRKPSFSINKMINAAASVTQTKTTINTIHITLLLIS